MKYSPDKMKQIFEKAKEGMGEVLDTALDGAETILEKAKDGAEIAIEKTSSGAAIVLDKTKDGIAIAYDKTIDLVTKEKKDELELAEQELSEQAKKEKISLDDELKREIDQYNNTYSTLHNIGMELHIQRERAIDLIENVTTLINSIANHPKEFDKEIAEIEANKKEFVGVCEFAKKELEFAKKSAMGAGAGVSAGAGVAALAPTAAMWVATTFGTASTGTAISTLSGAAATNAALAWLGGGAVTAGGGGMAAGNAFLALAGPVGWSIAGATLLASVTLFATNKMKINKKKAEEIAAVKQNSEALMEVCAKANALLNETVTLRNELNKQYSNCLKGFGKNYFELSEEQQMLLGSLVNNTKAISASLSQNI